MKKEYILQIQDIMKKRNIRIWLMKNSSHNDRFFEKFISKRFATSPYAVITVDSAYLLLNELDKNNVDKTKLDKNLKILIYSTQEELENILEDIIAKLKFSKKFALTYSTMNDQNIDILGHGEFLSLSKSIKKIYAKYDKKVRFESAEKIIYELCSSKQDEEIERMKLISAITLEILEETFLKIKVGMTEKEVYLIIRNISKEVMDIYIGSNDIVGFDFGWEPCPIVLLGENLEKGGHSIATDKKLKKGDTIYFDFGLSVEFIDGRKLCTDMQRMGYVLKDKEKTAPKKVTKVFNTLVKAIEQGMEEMRPSVLAYKIDEIVRNSITKENYPNYSHATGHPVGEDVHDIGAIITQKSSKLANLELVKNGVYTLEPRIQIPNGGSIEEMILVTEYGGVSLCKAQKKLYIV